MAYITREHAPDPANRPQQVRPAEPAYPAPPARDESRGCLFALSQPPLILFLTVIGALLLIAGAHDTFLL
ncbi:hypothetical protein [Streptomyces sp. 6N223]|uniref:hypothetical protein n=1 Tax=Streptomyces sp. 6N223 TaxID=3457412 RepID=UPI003FD22C90